MRLAGIVIFTTALTFVATLHSPATARADAAADVLAQEARWLKAITDGDRGTVESILSANFRHITSDGELLDRAQEIANTKPLFVTMTPSEQIVDVVGNAALIHGVNTISNAGGVVGRARFTDVFVLSNGTWLAVSAQETAI